MSEALARAFYWGSLLLPPVFLALFGVLAARGVRSVRRRHAGNRDPIPGARRHAWVLPTSLILSGAGSLALWHSHDTSLEYGADCGHFRRCESRLFGLVGSCSPTAPEHWSRALRRFAPAERCSDWHTVSWVSRSALGRFHGAGGDQLFGFAALESYASVRELAKSAGQSTLADDQARIPALIEELAPGGLGPYAVRDCEGRKRREGDDDFEVFLAAELDGTPPEDCWSLDASGALRHLHHDES